MSKNEQIKFINHFGKPAYKFYIKFPRLFTICYLYKFLMILYLDAINDIKP